MQAPELLTARDESALEYVARVVLPAQLDGPLRTGAVGAFAGWVRGYAADAEMDHGYGFTRLRETGSHPGPGYRRDLQNLRAAADRQFGIDIEQLDNEQLRSLVSMTLDELDDATDEARDLPGRPGDQHVIIALMSHWFRSPAAQDRCYEMRIGRESCRGLFTNVDGLEPLAGD